MMKPNNFAATLAAALIIGGAVMADTNLEIKFAGALEFSEDGTLFVEDNHNGAIYAFETEGAPFDGQMMPSSVSNIDMRIADLLGVGPAAIEINDIAAHPVSNDIYISVSTAS